MQEHTGEYLLYSLFFDTSVETCLTQRIHLEPFFSASMDKKNITVGCRVEGACGALIPNSNGSSKRRKRETVAGTVVDAAGHNKWEVVFDYDGSLQVISSKALKVINDDIGLPISDELIS